MAAPAQRAPTTTTSASISFMASWVARKARRRTGSVLRPLQAALFDLRRAGSVRCCTLRRLRLGRGCASEGSLGEIA